MAGKMLLVNPKKRRARRKTSARKKTPARRRTTRRAAPKRTTRAVRRRTSRTPARRRRNPARRGIMGKYLQPALMGGGTAVGIDVAMGYIPLPGVLSTGMARHATKAAAALGFGMFAGNLGIVKKGTAEEMARGALTVYAADMIREGFSQFLPDVTLGYYSPAYVPPDSGMQAYVNGMGEYVSGGTANDPFGYQDQPTYETGLNEYVDIYE